MSKLLDRKIKLFVNDRNYSGWYFIDSDTSQPLSTEEYPELSQINPLENKIFGRDTFMINEKGEINVIYSYVKSSSMLAGVLILENNKTFGRTENKKRLLYKCVPDDVHLPAFLVPYEVKLGFSKLQKNKYVVFRYENWNNKHPQGMLVETLGSVDNLEVFYEYQLYCKSLNASITDFTNKTRAILSKKTNDEYVDHIFANPNFGIKDYRDRYIFTIDPPNGMDFDDGFSIEEFMHDGEICFRVSIYIANVYVWLETFGLWNSFSQRVATIYLPDRRRPMLPNVLSDILCSLQENVPRFAMVMEYHVNKDGKFIDEIPVTYSNVLITVKKNYVYEDADMVMTDVAYNKLLDISGKIDRSVKNSHDLVAFWMVQMNKYTGLLMADQEVGIFRSAMFVNSHLRMDIDESLSEDASRVIRSWNNTIGQYVVFDKDAILDHEMMSLRYFKRESSTRHCYSDIEHKMTKSYIHITSPIRRLVDLLNQIMLLQNRGMIKNVSASASQFLESWKLQIDYINVSMRSIRKVQTDCEVLNRCFKSPEIMDKEYEGIVFDKIIKNDGAMHYMVYLESLKLLSRIVTHVDVDNYSRNKFKMFLFEDEDKVKKKIRLQIVLSP